MITRQYHYWRGRYCPIIEFEVLNGNRETRTMAYLDTGATYSVFTADYCERLGLSLHSGKRVDITVGDGGIIPVYLHELTIRLDDLEIRAEIGFSDRLGIGINIVGRAGILDGYKVCFDGKKREVVWHV